MENGAGNIFQHPAAENQEMHCVHIEGKNPSDESLKQIDKETKCLEQVLENDDKGKGEDIQLISISARAEEKCNESEIDKKSTTPSKESNQKEDTSKSKHIGGKKNAIKNTYILGNDNNHKLNETDGEEEFPKCIGDKKRVQFLVEDAKKPWSHNFKHSKNREIRNTSTNKKINDPKRQRLLTDRNRSPQRENLKQKGDLNDTLKKRNMSPERDKPNHLIKNKIKEKVKEKVGVAKPQKPECKVIEKTDQDQDDSGEDYWSKSNNDSVYHLGVLQVSGDSADISTNHVDSPDGVERDGLVIRKSLSAENKDFSEGSKEISKAKKYSSDAALADSRRMQKEEEEEEEIIAQASHHEEHSHKIDTADVTTNDGENLSNTCEREEGKPSVSDESSGEENRENNLEGTSNKLRPPSRSQQRLGRWAARALCCSGWALWAAWVLRLAGVLPRSLPNLVPALAALLLALLLLHVMWLANLPDAPATAPTTSPDAPGGSRQDVSATSLPTTLRAPPLQQSTE